MGSPGVVEGTQTMKILLAGAFLAVALAAPEAAPEAAASPEANADPWYGYYGRPYAYGYGYRPYGYDTITERGLLMLSPLLLLLLMLLLPLMLMPGTDTMAGLMPTVMDTGLMAMDTTMERDLMMLSPLLRLLLPLRLMLMPGTDTMAMVCTDPMAMDTMDTGPMVITGERSKKHDSCQTAAN